MTLEEIRQHVERKKGQREQLEKDLKRASSKIRECSRLQKRIEKAQAIIQQVAKLTQEELEFHISELVSLALEAVFPDPYKLKVDFVLRRNQTEADLKFCKEKAEPVHPMSASGGGTVDVGAFALRKSLWSLMPEKTRPIFILDEPFRNINDPSRELQQKSAEMLKMLSEKLGLQIIMVSLNKEVGDIADKSFEIVNVKGRSMVR